MHLVLVLFLICLSGNTCCAQSSRCPLHSKDECNSGQVSDPCICYNTLGPYDFNRLKESRLHTGDAPICDKHDVTSGCWYRIRSDRGDYAVHDNESCIAMNSCGTEHPMWIPETLPQEYNVIVDRTVCGNDGTNGPDCCSWRKSIQVKKCREYSVDKFFVFRLVSPDACFAAYCAKPVNIIRTTTTSSPSGELEVRLDGPLIEDQSVVFYCEIKYQYFIPNNRLRFSVKFLFGGSLRSKPPQQIPIESYARIKLEESFLRGNLGTSLSCEVETIDLDNPNHNREPFEKSQEYFMGMYLVDENLDSVQRISIREGEPVKSHYLLSTLPIVCANNCAITARWVTKEDAHTRNSVCNVTLQRTSWRSNEQKAYDFSQPIKLDIQTDFIVRQWRTTVFEFEKFNFIPGYLPLWDDYQIPSLQVALEERPRGLCEASGDPHIRTPDGAMYHLFDIGQFLLWKSKAHRKFEVHIRNWLCPPSGTVSCVCAVAVREGSTVLGIDMCGGEVPDVPRVRVIQYGQYRHLPPGSSITRDATGRHFEITMPSSARVEAHVFSFGMNLFVTGLPEDSSSSYGLCGNVDGNRYNDLTYHNGSVIYNAMPQDRLPRRFTELYRIPEGNSLFDAPPTWDEPSDDTQKCRCNSDTNTVVCNFPKDAGPPNTGAQYEVDILLQTNNKNRRKRQAEYSDEIADVDYDFTYISNERLRTDFFWPTPNGITYEEANAACNEAKSKLRNYPTCRRILDEVDITQCTTDIKLMNSIDYADAFLDVLTASCLKTTLEEPSTYQAGSNSTKQLSCKGFCSKHGSCTNGNCVCSSGYVGPDCNVDTSEPPLLHAVIGGETCDINTRPCKKVRTLVTNIYDAADNLVCVFTEAELSNGKWQSIGESTRVQAVLQTFTEVTCLLTHDIPKHEYSLKFVAVSTDGGITHSNEKLVILAHSDCFSCNADKGCTRTENDNPLCTIKESGGLNVVLIASLVVVLVLILIVVIAGVYCFRTRPAVPETIRKLYTSIKLPNFRRPRSTNVVPPPPQSEDTPPEPRPVLIAPIPPPKPRNPPKLDDIPPAITGQELNQTKEILKPPVPEKPPKPPKPVKVIALGPNSTIQVPDTEYQDLIKIRRQETETTPK